MNPAHEYLTHRALIERTIQTLARRHRLSSSDADDFASVVHLRLIEHDYAALRAFEGRSALSTYLFAVIRHVLQDWRKAQWGRWRPSRAAIRIGPTAVLLESLVGRDGLSLEQAVTLMTTNHHVTESAAELRTMAALLPARARRSVVSDEVLLEQAAADTADGGVMEREAAEAAARVGVMLDAAITRLAPQDRVILQLRFEEGLPMPAIGRMVGVSGRLLYGRVERLLAALRRALEAEGVTAADAARVLASRGFDFAPTGFGGGGSDD